MSNPNPPQRIGYFDNICINNIKDIFTYNNSPAPNAIIIKRLNAFMNTMNYCKIDPVTGDVVGACNIKSERDAIKAELFDLMTPLDPTINNNAEEKKKWRQNNLQYLKNLYELFLNRLQSNIYIEQQVKEFIDNAVNIKKNGPYLLRNSAVDVIQSDVIYSFSDNIFIELCSKGERFIFFEKKKDPENPNDTDQWFQDCLPINSDQIFRDEQTYKNMIARINDNKPTIGNGTISESNAMQTLNKIADKLGSINNYATCKNFYTRNSEAISKVNILLLEINRIKTTYSRNQELELYTRNIKTPVKNFIDTLKEIYKNITLEEERVCFNKLKADEKQLLENIKSFNDNPAWGRALESVPTSGLSGENERILDSYYSDILKNNSDRYTDEQLALVFVTYFQIDKKMLTAEWLYFTLQNLAGQNDGTLQTIDIAETYTFRGTKFFIDGNMPSVINQKLKSKPFIEALKKVVAHTIMNEKNIPSI